MVDVDETYAAYTGKQVVYDQLLSNPYACLGVTQLFDIATPPHEL